MRRRFAEYLLIGLGTLFAVAFAVPRVEAAEKLQQETRQAWETYEKFTEKRIFDNELSDKSRFLVLDFMSASDSRKARDVLKSGKVYVQKMVTSDDKGKSIPVTGGLIHHWYGAILIPNVKVETLVRWIQDYNSTSKYFKEVKESKLLPRRDGDSADTFRIYFRLTRTKFLTMNYSTWHTVVYRHHGIGQTSSRSFTTKIAELSEAGTASEKELPEGDDSGFLWRLNSYWRFKQEGDGVIVECESISLSRGIPATVGFLNALSFGTIRRVIESLPRESLETTLTSIHDGVPKAR
jgi:hypothetical protein